MGPKDFAALAVTYTFFAIFAISPPLALAVILLLIYPGSIIAAVIGSALGLFVVAATAWWLIRI